MRSPRFKNSFAILKRIPNIGNIAKSPRFTSSLAILKHKSLPKNTLRAAARHIHSFFFQPHQSAAPRCKNCCSSVANPTLIMKNWGVPGEIHTKASMQAALIKAQNKSGVQSSPHIHINLGISPLPGQVATPLIPWIVPVETRHSSGLWTINLFYKQNQYIL